MFPSYGRDKRTDHERYLEDELQREREATRQSQEREDEAREQRRQEWREQAEYERRQASSWPEAFQKQASLCWREHNQYPEEEGDDFFSVLAQANEKALEIWREVAASKAIELDELQRQIGAVWSVVRGEVADRLEAASDRVEYRSTANVIRKDQLAGYLDW